LRAGSKAAERPAASNVTTCSKVQQSSPEQMVAAHLRRKGDETSRPASKQKKETRQIARNYDKKDRNPALPKGFNF
jgi:hypothetical protein